MVDLSYPTYDFDFGPGIPDTRGLLCSDHGAVRRSMITATGRRAEVFRYRLNDHQMSRALGMALSPDLADLIDVFSALYIADRLSPRAVTCHDRQRIDQRYRRIAVRVPVRLDDRWSAPETRVGLEGLLCYLSGDSWNIYFVPRRLNQRLTEVQTHLPMSERPSRPVVILHSGVPRAY